MNDEPKVWDEPYDPEEDGEWAVTPDNDDFYDDDETVNRICPRCNGTGGDRWNDGITPCDYCDGEGYLYWM